MSRAMLKGYLIRTTMQDRRGTDPALDNLCTEVYKRRYVKAEQRESLEAYMMRSHVHRDSIQAEDTILNYLADLGHSTDIREDTVSQFADIDAYLDDTSVSIKCQHTGLKYGDLCFEVATMKGHPSQSWEPSELNEWLDCFQRYNVWLKKSQNNRWSRVPAWDTVNLKTWYPGWYITGKAEQYLIWQGDRLMLFDKLDIMVHVLNHGFSHICGLTERVLIQENHKDTICGYLKLAEMEKYIKAEWVLSQKLFKKPG